LAEPSAPTPSTSFSLAPETPPLALSPQPSAIDQKTSHLLRVQAKETTWIHVIIDGEQEKDVLLQPGEKVEWSAQKGFVLTLGNAGGSELTFNGKDLPPLGASGQVIRDLRLPSAEEEERG
jgi:cytoskeleton protein RodZ